MLSTYTSANRVVSVGLLTQYRRVYDADSYDQPFWQYTRIRTKAYSYVGLSESAAKACAEAMQAYYTRTFPMYEWKFGRWQVKAGASYQDCVAEVGYQHDEGHLWHVDVQVNEQAIIYSPDVIADLPAAFTAAGFDWSYDEE